MGKRKLPGERIFCKVEKQSIPPSLTVAPTLNATWPNNREATNDTLPPSFLLAACERPLRSSWDCTCALPPPPAAGGPCGLFLAQRKQ